MEKDGKRKLKGKISTKKEAKDKIDILRSVDGDWEVDLKTNQMTLNLKGLRKGEGVSKSGLTTADKEWIADLVVTSIQTGVKPINQRLTNIENRLDIIEEDMKNVKKDIKAIKECPTIKKELKKVDK